MAVETIFTSQEDPLSTAGGPQEEPQTHHPARGRRRHHHSSSRGRLIVILSLSLAVETVLLLTAYVRMGLAENESLALELSERQQTAELEKLRPQVEKLRAELATLVESRLPGLTKLEFDKVLPIDRDYVKNIVFSVAGKGDQLQYEYKMTTHNGSINLVHPQVDILIFDHLGIQVGVSRIGIQMDGTPTLDILERGESRSFSARVDMTDDVRPEYFRLRIRN